MRTSLASYARWFGLAAALGLFVACQTTPPADGRGVLTPYTITLRSFSDREAVSIISGMAGDFPGYRSHELISRSGRIRHYRYLSTAKTYELEEWLFGLFGRLGLDAEHDVLVEVAGTELTLERLTSPPAPSDPPDPPRNRQRFR